MIINNKNKSKIEELLNLYYWVIGDEKLLFVLDKYSNCEGFGVENIWCCFANEFQEWEEDYFGESGVEYYFDYPALEKDCMVILTYKEFYEYLLDFCKKYVEKHSEEKDIIYEYLNNIKVNLNLNL
ncbi:ribonuclease toxin immunity protein CdiI [Hathewaya histolytica]|uniref:CDI immunity protein domain-containing protein n=1 Tax=Hathewaya histolytica TaxID=1498 RepID=A0A4V6KBX8_HATHI|nr:ribonuclease toxin immunity protein CdiI [Hathewaya histolytica]VTQ84267.1 Uncharacterised protein [Hathewaya histolytica]